MLLQRFDETLTDPQGWPVSGAALYICYQPANTTSPPPSPLVTLYKDPNGLVPLTAAPVTDQNGHVSCYLQSGVYTVCFYSTQIATSNQMLVLTDQNVANPSSVPQFNNDSTISLTITPQPNGHTVGFTLSAAPTPPQSLLLFANGILQTAYAFSNRQIVFETAPPAGTVLTATYGV